MNEEEVELPFSVLYMLIALERWNKVFKGIHQNSVCDELEWSFAAFKKDIGAK